MNTHRARRGVAFLAKAANPDNGDPAYAHYATSNLSRLVHSETCLKVRSFSETLILPQVYLEVKVFC